MPEEKKKRFVRERIWPRYVQIQQGRDQDVFDLVNGRYDVADPLWLFAAERVVRAYRREQREKRRILGPKKKG